MRNNKTIFYSWLSDLPSRANKKLIRNALRSAAMDIDEKNDDEDDISVDEATRDTSGSPNISQTIFEKIAKADIFICDVSIVSSQEASKNKTLRAFINPNVSIELGYAVALLGWDRIILVQNTAYGSPELLPFDIRGHRVTTYNYSSSEPINADDKSKMKNAQGRLKHTLIEAISLIKDTTPRGKALQPTLDPEKTKRQRDLMQLEEVSKYLNVNLITNFSDRIIQNSRVGCIGAQFGEFFSTAVSQPSFYLYDEKLKQHLIKLAKAWGDCSEHETSMRYHETKKELYFHTPGDFFQSRKQSKLFNLTQEAGVSLRKKLTSLLNFIREHYLEIDIETMGVEFLDKWLEE